MIENEVELIVLSGYMRILTSDFVKPWAGRILNIHPSLLPDFPGAHAHRDVISAGVKKSGCTVHFVDSGMDTGPIIAQKEVEVLADDDESSLGERIKIEEHKLYPKVIDQLAAGETNLNRWLKFLPIHSQDSTSEKTSEICQNNLEQTLC